MAIDKECIGYARDCERLAGLTNDRELRERLLQMAREWMAMSIRQKRVPEANRLKPVNPLEPEVT
jgi:hypothetical protein